MKRNLETLKKENFDILIIGGGISGAAIAWDASLRGYKVALVERKDFGHGTSSATSKLIHGGLRYLAQFDIQVVRESLKERRFLEKNMPHLAFSLPFLLPIYKWQPMPRWMLWIGLTLYDLLSYGKNFLDDKEKHLPNKKWLSKEKTLQMEPGLIEKDLLGAFLYYDVLNQFPDRSNLEYILSAHEKGCVAANYVSCKNFLITKKDENKTVEGINAVDELTGEEFSIHSKVTINATGPWGDIVLESLGQKPSKKLIRSKGIHILLPKVQKKKAITFETRDKKHFFMIPWLDYTLVGTTDTPYTKHPDKLKVTRSDAGKLLELTNEYFPTNFGFKDILHAYAGIRPLVADSESATYNVSRKHEIVYHKKYDNVDGLVSVFGGKWTTSRALAEEAIDLVQKRFSFPNKKSNTKDTPFYGAQGIEKSYTGYVKKMKEKYKSQYNEELVEHLIETYGSHFYKIFDASKSKSDLKPLGENINHVLAQVDYSVTKEMAQTLEDVLMRRIGLGNVGVPPKQILKSIAERMGKLLGWSEKRQQSEISEFIKSQKIID